MDFTIEFNSGGNHGHKLKDALGGMTIGHLFDLNFVHTPISYLDFFGIGHNYPVQRKLFRRFKYRKVKRITGPTWRGINDYEEMKNYFKNDLSNTDTKSTLYVFNKALRVHPFQTVPWYKEGKLKYDIFSTILEEISTNFAKLHSLKMPVRKNIIEVAVHINRGLDYDIKIPSDHFESSDNPRYMFSMDYFENIMEQIEKVYGTGNANFKIYTERLNSEVITSRFDKRPNTKVLLGTNRTEKNDNLIHSIFKAFVEADILVCSNSSFSAMCAYFRKDRKTIYHAHKDLRYLPKPN